MAFTDWLIIFLMVIVVMLGVLAWGWLKKKLDEWGILKWL